MSTFNKELCENRKQQVNDILESHARKLDEHEKEIELVNRTMGVYGERIDNLVVNVKELVDSLKWQNRLVITTLLSAIGSIALLGIQLLK